MKRKRNYRREYDQYHGKPEQIARRGKRTQARRMLEKEGAVSPGDGKDVHHVDDTHLSNKRAQLKVTTPAKNRSDGGKKRWGL
jgi:hypothetical protein